MNITSGALSAPDPTCPKCSRQFQPRRSNQRYCGRTCQKAATSHSARGSRQIENSQRNRDHYVRAAWLSYDVNRMPEAKRQALLCDQVASAKGGNARLRNILTDPKLLGADRASPIGKLYPDSRDHAALNIAKLVHRYCRRRWGMGLRQLLEPGCSVVIMPEPFEAKPEAPMPVYVRQDSGAFLAHIRAIRTDRQAIRLWRKAMKAALTSRNDNQNRQQDMDGDDMAAAA